jgi:hypothetical protein
MQDEPLSLNEKIGTIRNLGEPLRFENVDQIDGFSAEAAKEGERVKVWTKLSITSDNPIFHKLLDNLAGVIAHVTNDSVRLAHSNKILLIYKPDRNLELWIDTAAISIQCIIKRSMEAGTVIMESDIADRNSRHSDGCPDFG